MSSYEAAKVLATHPSETAEAAELLAAHDQEMADAGLDLQLDGPEAVVEARARPQTDQELERQAGEIATLRRELEQTQVFVRQMIEAGQGVAQVGGQAANEERRRVHQLMTRALIERGGRCVILIHPDPTPTHNWPVPLSINGNRILVKRGVPTDIPVEYVEVLENARVEQTMPLLDAQDNPIPGGVVVDQLSYPYTLLPGATPEERLGEGFRGEDRDLAQGANQPRIAA